jgi:Ca2+-binding RTX toxin-like protein
MGGVALIQFANGTQWTEQDLIDRIAITTGNDHIYGDDNNNVFSMLDGNDFVDAGGGRDEIHGGNGNDEIHLGAGGDVDQELAYGDAGDDLLYGDAGNDGLIGGTGSDHLYGGADDDDLNGDTGSAADGSVDYLYGGTGNDDYDLHESGDQIIEYANEGYDRVYLNFAGAWTLPDNVEAVRLMTTDQGTQITGNALDNELFAGNNTNAQRTNSSLGVDVLSGGFGNDFYRNVSYNDVVIESVNAGIDTVSTSMSYYTLGANVENGITEQFYADGYGYSFASRTLTGNDLDNVLTAGTSEDHYISGGNGNDTINGSAGSDQISGDAGNDVINGGSGNDRIYSGAGINDISGGYGNDELHAEGSSDIVTGGSGDDHLILGAGFANCVFYATSGVDLIDPGAGNFALDFRNSYLNDIQSVTTSGGLLWINYKSTQADPTGVSTLKINLAGLDKLVSVTTLDGAMTASAFYQWLVEHPDRYTSNASILAVGDIGQYQVSRDGADLVVHMTTASNGSPTSFSLQNATLIDPYRIDPDGALRLIGAPAGISSLLLNQGYSNELRLSLGDDGADNFSSLDRAGITDWYVGGKGIDTYAFSATSGSDRIDLTSADTARDVILVNGLKSSVYFNKDWSTNGLTVNFNGVSGNGLNISRYFDDAVVAPLIRFSNGEEFTIDNFYYQFYGSTSGNDTLTGTAGDDVLWGWKGNDVLTGMGGNDDLDGGSGADQMTGGAGDDYYHVDNAGDTVVELSGGGTDVIETSVNYTLSSNVEVGRAIEGSASVSIVGNALNNTLIGNDGSNRLDGGSGTDYMVGGRGDDIYVVDNVTTSWVLDDVSRLGDVIDEWESYNSGYGGNDTVEASVAYTLGNYLENLTLTGSAAIAGTGNALDNVLRGNSGSNVLKGKAGNDTYYVSTGDTVTENANEGTDTVISDVTFTLGSNVENLTLTGTSAINGTGNTLSNVLIGNDAANTLDGGSGDDLMQGGLGNDIYVVDNMFDTVVEQANAGTDTVQSSITWSLASAANVENLTLTGTSAINATGNALDNVLTGNSAINQMAGGAGNDIYVVTSGDIISENANEGIDTVQSSITWSIATTANVENITLTGTSAINATGNALDNVLTGNSGINIFTGGAGNDTYVVGTGDSITENANEGTDTVLSSITWTLATAANVENLTLTGTSAINGTGNALANLIIGNDGDNLIDGGAGIDTMQGGLGNDTYTVDNSSDVVTEAAGAGTDLVNASVNYVLSANVENITLTGTSAINATGNALDNVLTGNSGVNVLTGGAGNDTYVVTSGDTVTENANEGIDTIQSSITWTLASTANVENLTLTGSTAINATGNALDNVLTGNSAINQMAGGAGNDTYIVSSGDLITENANEGIDTIMSSITWTIASTANVENITLTGTTAINATGNALDNVLVGNSAANVMTGGAGNDTYYVSTGDSVTEAASAGTDTVITDITWSLASTVNIENLTLTGAAAINGTGNTAANIIIGNDGNNVLDGGAGIDTMQGGLGNDTYVVDNSSDVVVELAGAGTDLVNASVNYVLSANVESITLTGTGAINATGNALDNVLTGNSGVNVLTGGAGNDTYVVGTGDTIVESANEGTDLVQSNVTFSIATFANVENLTLTGTTAINGTGNALDNVLTGNSAANVMTGGAGNDTYYVSTGDTVTENANEGTDTVITDITWTLAATANIENLTLTGSTAINATGNTAANVLRGNSGNNTLTGAAGNDTYLFGLGGASDTIVDTDSTAGNADKLLFDAGTAYDQLWFKHTGTSLEVSIIGTSDKVTISNWYNGSSNHVERIQVADGHYLLDTQVEALVQAMAGMTPPAAGQTSLTTAQHQQLDAVLTANWAA